MKDCALGLVLKVRFFGTWKWPISFALACFIMFPTLVIIAGIFFLFCFVFLLCCKNLGGSGTYLGIQFPYKETGRVICLLTCVW